jgi:hypothetical protein
MYSFSARNAIRCLPLCFALAASTGLVSLPVPAHAQGQTSVMKHLTADAFMKVQQ